MLPTMKDAAGAADILLSAVSAVLYDLRICRGFSESRRQILRFAFDLNTPCRRAEPLLKGVKFLFTVKKISLPGNRELKLTVPNSSFFCERCY